MLFSHQAHWEDFPAHSSADVSLSYEATINAYILWTFKKKSYLSLEVLVLHLILL